MMNLTYDVRGRFFISLIIGLFLLAGASSFAEDPPENTNFVKSLVPDSSALDNKVIYVDFWASWCVPCRASLPWMQKLYDKYHKSGFEIVAVNVDKDHKSAVKFLKDNQISFPVVFDSTGDVAKQYSLETMPSSFLYDRGGHLVMQHRGFSEEDTDSLSHAIWGLINKEAQK